MDFSDNLRFDPAWVKDAAPGPDALPDPSPLERAVAELGANGSARILWLPRTATTATAVVWCAYRGHRFLSVREWWRRPDGRWLPTRRGATVRASDLLGFVNGVCMLETVPRDLGDVP